MYKCMLHTYLGKYLGTYILAIVPTREWLIGSAYEGHIDLLLLFPARLSILDDSRLSDLS